MMIKKCPNFHQSIDVLNFSGNCPNCHKKLVVSAYFSLGLLVFLMAVLCTGIYLENQMISLMSLMSILVYKLFSYQIDFLLFPFKTNQSS